MELPATLHAASWSSLAYEYAAARRGRRQRAREHIHRWVVHPIDMPRRVRDPLARRVAPLTAALSMARLLAIAVVLHALMLSVMIGAGRMIGKHRLRQTEQLVQLRIIETLPDTATTPDPEASVSPPEFETMPAPPRLEPAAAKPPEPPTRVVRRPKPTEAPSPNEVEVPPATPTAPRQRVVGLSMESTVTGAGPRFATGTTRMGETAARAVDAELAMRAHDERGKGEGSPLPANVNRVATLLPTAGPPIVRPRRLSGPEAEYPPLLRRQGIEGDVLLLATIGKDGSVKAVEIVQPSAHAEFNEAALAAARLARYAPAMQGHEPVEFAQRYTVRFRIHD